MPSSHPKLDAFLKSAAQEWQKMTPGLERIQAACGALGHPERLLPSVHVAGTNGKGSVCAMLQAILGEAGCKAGLFTSPHLLRVNERFRVGEIEISDAELEDLLDSLEAAGVLPRLSFFEACTLIAFLYFFAQRADVAILETGLGGRLDATNVVEPLVSVITEIGMDHAEILGPDIASIAREKVGILKEGVPAVCGARHPEARRVIEACAREKQVPLHWVEEGGEFPYALALEGEHQVWNARIVLKTLEVLASNPAFAPISEEAIRLGFAKTRWPGRLEWISRDPPILLDGAHNPEGMRALANYLKRGEPLRWKALFSAASDKKVREMLSILGEVAADIVVCRMEHSRSINPSDFPAYSSAADAWQAFQAQKKSLREGEGILITGSLYFIAQFLREFRGIHPTSG